MIIIRTVNSKIVSVVCVFHVMIESLSLIICDYLCENRP